MEKIDLRELNKMTKSFRTIHRALKKLKKRTRREFLLAERDRDILRNVRSQVGKRHLIERPYTYRSLQKLIRPGGKCLRH